MSDSFTSGLNDTFGAGFSDKMGGVMGNVASRVAGDYVSQKVSKKIGGPLGSLLGNTIGGAVGSTIGDTVSGAFSSSGSQTLGLNSSESSNANSGTGIDMNPSIGGSEGSKVKTPRASTPQEKSSWNTPNTQRPSSLLGTRSTLNKPAPLTQPTLGSQPAPNKNLLMGPLGPVTNPVTGKPVKVMSFAANAKPSQFGDNARNMVQRTPSPAPKPLGTTQPMGLSAQATASNARTAQALVKTTDHSAIKPHIQDALKTGGAKAQIEVQDLTQQMDKLSPGSGTKLAREVGVNIPQPEPKTALKSSSQDKMDMNKSLDTLRNGKPEDVHALAKELGNMKDGQGKMPAELKRFSEGYKAHKAAQNIPPAPKASDFKKPKSFLIAQKHYAKILASREAEAVRAGVSHFMAPSLCR